MSRSVSGRRAAALLAAALLLVLLLFASESLRGAGSDSQTLTEAVNVASGYGFLHSGRLQIGTSEPPLAKAFFALPLLALAPDLDPQGDAWKSGDDWVAGYEFLWENRVPGPRLLAAARLPVIAAGTLLVLLAFLAALALYGRLAALVAVVAAATCPELLARSHLATPDVPLALAGSVTLALLLSFAARPTRARHALLALAIGAALATSTAAILLLPALALAAVARALLDPGLAGRGRVAVPAPLARSTPRLQSLYVLLGGTLAACGYGLLVLAATCGGRLSPLLTAVQAEVEAAARGVPGWPPGTSSRLGQAGLHLAALGQRMPLLLAALFGAALLSWKSAPLGRGRSEVPALVWAATVLGIACLWPGPGGARLLLILPVILVFASRLVAVLPGGAGRRGAIAAVLVAGFVAEALAARPGYLSYRNELARVPGWSRPRRLDAGLDWGQDVGRLAGWLRGIGNPPVRLALFSNVPPAFYGIRFQALPAAGPALPPPPTLLKPGSPDLLCISASNLSGRFLDPELYGWLATRPPVAEIGGSISCYDLDGRSEDHRRLARVYGRAGWARWEAHEARIASLGESRVGASGPSGFALTGRGDPVYSVVSVENPGRTRKGR